MKRTVIIAALIVLHSLTMQMQAQTNGRYVLDTVISCDSILVIDTAVCDSLVMNGEVYKSEGSYAQWLQTAEGRDSLIVINITDYHERPVPSEIHGYDTVTPCNWDKSFGRGWRYEYSVDPMEGVIETEWTHTHTALLYEDGAAQIGVHSGGNPFAVVYIVLTWNPVCDTLYFRARNECGWSDYVCKRILTTDEVFPPYHYYDEGIEENGIILTESFPNPTTGIFHVETGLEGITEVVVYDTEGRQVLKQTSEGGMVEIDLGNRPAGLYYYAITDGEKRLSGKVLKK